MGGGGGGSSDTPLSVELNAENWVCGCVNWCGLKNSLQFAQPIATSGSTPALTWPHWTGLSVPITGLVSFRGVETFGTFEWSECVQGRVAFFQEGIYFTCGK